MHRRCACGCGREVSAEASGDGRYVQGHNSYSVRHKILGSVAKQKCALEFDGCTKQANHWALDWLHVRPVNLRKQFIHGSKAPRVFSIGPDDDYIAVCRGCHAKFDQEFKAFYDVVLGNAER